MTRLRHRLSTGPPRLRAAMGAVAVVVLLACAAGIPVRAAHGAQTTADEPQYLLSAISLAEDRDLDIADELVERRWLAFHEAQLPQQTRPLPGDQRLSPHDPLLPLLLAAPVELGGWVGAKLAMAVAAAALVALLLWTAVRRFHVPLPAAAAVTLALGVSPPLVVYGTQIYPELPAALAVLAAVAALTGPPGRRQALVAGAAVVALPWLATKYAPVAACLAVLELAILWRSGHRRLAAASLAALGAAGAAFLGVHQALYGGWTPYAAGDHFVAGEFGAAGLAPNYAGRGVRLVGLLVDRDFGLAAWQPAWLLAVPALAALARARPPGWAALAAPAVTGWLVATFVALTMHGWWWPGRQVVVVLPCVALAIAWWTGATAARLRGALLAAAGGVVAYGWILAEGWRGELTWAVDFFDTANPLYRTWRLALPDYQRTGLATWYLHGAWVAAALALAALGWRGRRRRPAGLRAGAESAPPQPGPPHTGAEPAAQAAEVTEFRLT
jgi:hypothetical protein